MRGKGGWKIVAVVILIVFLLAMVGATPSAWAASESDSSSATIYVPDDYPTIQAAVDAASTGDTIIVRDGEYRENIDVNKRLTVKSENGSGNCIIDAEDGEDDVFGVTADYVNINGFTVKGASCLRKAGIYLESGVDFCNISNNNVSNNYYSIYLGGSNNNIFNNKCSNSDEGIYLKGSNNKLKGNVMVEDGIYIVGVSLSNYIHEIDESNTVNGKPVYYWKDIEGGRIPEGAGQVILVNCTKTVVENQNFNSLYVCTEVAFSSNISIKNNNYSNNIHSIEVLYSKNNNISKNFCSKNSYDICLWDSNSNNISSNVGDIDLYHSNNNSISSNVGGIYLWDSHSNSILNNNCSNAGFGISLWISNHNNISNNNCLNNWRGISLHCIYEYSNDLVIIPTYVYDNNISNNNCSNCDVGIFLEYSICNRIYLNNFINNAFALHSFDSGNIWNSPEQITYTYNGSRCTNYLGNYWDDYTGTDADGDGLGDTTYPINSDKDNYPLMQPWENYFVEENGTRTNTKNETQKFAFSSYYQPINISVNHSVPPYPLPLNLSTITNIENITTKFQLTETEEELLETNGFVISDYGQKDDIVAPYKDMKEMGIPIFVTTDTLLHLYHIQFNEILKGIEEREFFDELVDMSNAMLNQSVKDYENFDDPELKESARRNVAYFAVALKLLQTPTEGYSGEDKVINSSIPDYVIEDVNKEL
jgi:parallel beta-helix repeat protein